MIQMRPALFDRPASVPMAYVHIYCIGVKVIGPLAPPPDSRTARIIEGKVGESFQPRRDYKLKPVKPVLNVEPVGILA